MNTKSAAESYQRQSVESAPPLQVVRMLYQGALKFLAQAQQTDPVQNQETFQELLSNADAIVSELRTSLNHDAGEEIAERLDSLYDFCESQLAHATLKNETEPLEAASNVLRTLLDGWMQIELEGGRATLDDAR